MSDGTRSRIADLRDAGLSEHQIAIRLGLASATVAYHLRRLNADMVGPSDAIPAESRESADLSAPLSRTVVATRTVVAALLDAGMTRAQVAHELGLSKATVSYHARRLDRPVDTRCARRYDWEEIQQYYDEGHSVRKCMQRFGFSSASWFEAVKRGVVEARPAGMPIDDLLSPGTYRGRRHVKERLIKEGLKTAECERCGLLDWQGEPITLALHHVNGIRNDNRLENLHFLCPNCHSQTDTFAGRNLRQDVPRDGPAAGSPSERPP